MNVRAVEIQLFHCPRCRGDVELHAEPDRGGRVETGELRCRKCGAAYPIHRGIPRFVPPENYSSTFGFQWNRFRKTQLDSYSGLPISRDRFFRQTGWTPAALKGRRILDVGCGAGRFTEIALHAGAHVVAMDYSNAVEACRANFGDHERLVVVQADVYQLPFRPAQFDFVYCFGVLQHTPDVRAAFLALGEPLRPGGQLAIDLYPRQRANVLWPKYWLRPLTRRVPAERLFPLVERMVAALLPISLAIGRVPGIGRKLRYAVPVVNYEGILPLSSAQLKEWAILDTFDMLAPRYDQPQTTERVRAWFQAAAYEDVNVYRDGLVIGRGRRAAAPAADVAVAAGTARA